MVDLPRLEKAHEVDKSLWNAEVLLFVTILPLAFSLVVGIVTYWIDIDADINYFELAAQIIPILVLALVIEQRYFFQTLPSSPPTATVGSAPARRKRLIAKRERLIAKTYNYQVKMFLVLIGGEVAALWAAGSANPSRIAFAATTTGLVAGAIALMVSSGKGLLTSLGERKIAQRNKSVEEKFVHEEKSRLEAWKLLLKRAEEVPEAKRVEFEQLMEYGALLVREMDGHLYTDHFEEELQRLTRRREQTNDLTPGQEMALRVMRRAKSSTD